MKICVAAVEALRKKESQDETQFTTKIDSSLSSDPSAPHSWNVLIFRFLKHLSGHPVYDQTQGSGAVLSLLYS